MADASETIRIENPFMQGENAEDAGAEEQPDGGVESEAQGDSPKRTSRVRSILSSLNRRKWVFVIPALVLSAGLLWGIMSGYGWVEKIEIISPSREKVVPDNLYEESMAPFFISMPSTGDSAPMLMIRFSVVWDGAAAVRFRKRELEIRETIYDRLVALAGKDKDFYKDTEALEARIKGLFEKSLGREGLEVKVKESKAF